MTTTKKTTTRKKSTATKKPVTKAKPKVITQSIPDLPNNPFVYEVFDAASKMRSKAKKVEVLSKYKHPSITVSYTHLTLPTKRIV